MKVLNFFSDAGWLEDGDFTHAAWQAAVENGDTRQSYAAWVIERHIDAGMPFDATQVVLEEAGVVGDEDSGLHPLETWQEEVANLDTRRSYASWVANAREMDLLESLT